MGGVVKAGFGQMTVDVEGLVMHARVHGVTEMLRATFPDMPNEHITAVVENRADLVRTDVGTYGVMYRDQPVEVALG